MYMDFAVSEHSQIGYKLVLENYGQYGLWGTTFLHRLRQLEGFVLIYMTYSKMIHIRLKLTPRDENGKEE